jgi:gamma-glutamylputrescine oxidase
MKKQTPESSASNNARPAANYHDSHSSSEPDSHSASQLDSSVNAFPDSSYPDSYYADTIKPIYQKLEYTNHFNDAHTEQVLEVETCIIGGGYAGLMTALSLIERGHKNVVVLEKNKVGWGASGRNGGFVFGGYSLGPAALVKQVGLTQARELYQMTTSAVDLIRKRINQYDIECDLVDKGVIWANWFKEQKLLLKEQAFMAEAMQVEWQYLNPEQLKQQINTERYHGGLYEPNAMHFHPLNYALGIAAEIIRKGGRIIQNCEVMTLTDPSDLADHNSQGSAIKVVKTNQGNVQCKNVVLAGGGYLGGKSKICPPVSRSVLPIATYVMATEPLGDNLKKYINTQAAIYDTRFAFDYYRPLNDSRILWGGRISANTKTPQDLKAKLQQDCAKVFPELADVKVDYAWGGYMAYSQHQMAQIGQIAPNVWYGIGFGGHGVAPTTAAGEILASAICGENKHYQKFQPWGLPWNGGVFGPPAAQLSYWWYQTKDWLKERLEG